MAYPDYVRDKARDLRARRKLTIDELAECLAISRTTAHAWVRDMPIGPSVGQTRGRRLATAAMQAKFRRLREDAYEDGLRTFDGLAADPTFRDFVNLYIAEGYKRGRNQVSLCNSDPAVVALADRWIRRLGSRKVAYSLQYHVDQDLIEVTTYWGALLGIPPESIELQRKSNSNRLTGRTWRSPHGVLNVRCCDTLLRARLEGWMDRLKECWLDSAPGA
ncbi:MAG TPA: hypothetical protein VNB64_00680 [Solirubrobacteraceae bacterium]|nr:hypothetical protein [Solirubrobacteraceae bacterium]